MRQILVLALGITMTVTACASNAPEPLQTDADFTSSGFEEKLVCDKDAAVLEQDTKVMEVLDVDHGEEKAQAIQFVVRDPNVVDYLSSKVSHIQNAKHEVILRGSIHTDQAFDSLEDWSVGTPFERPEGRKVRILEQIVGVVHRVQGESDQVRLVFNRTTVTRTCSTYFEQDYCAFDEENNKPGDMKTEREDVPVADWVFHCVAPSPNGKP